MNITRILTVAALVASLVVPALGVAQTAAKAPASKDSKAAAAPAPAGCPMMGGMGGMAGHGHMAMTPEQQKRCQELHEEMAKKAGPIKEDLWAKNLELQALSGNPKVEPAKISEMVAEIKKLRGQLSALHDEYRAKAKAENLPCGMGHGMGGMCGMCGGMMGGGMGHGMMGGGMGHGMMDGGRGMDHGKMGHGMMGGQQ